MGINNRSRARIRNEKDVYWIIREEVRGTFRLKLTVEHTGERIYISISESFLCILLTVAQGSFQLVSLSKDALSTIDY